MNNDSLLVISETALVRIASRFAVLASKLKIKNLKI
jgi:hypothetical protein